MIDEIAAIVYNCMLARPHSQDLLLSTSKYVTTQSQTNMSAFGIDQIY